jgi:hypothetical protein
LHGGESEGGYGRSGLIFVISDDDKLALCITEQRSGFQGAIRVYEMSHEGDCKNREQAGLESDRMC